MSTRILDVDDDTALAEMIGFMLESEGHTPSFCADGAKAMDIFRQVEPDLVLLDLMLVNKIFKYRWWDVHRTLETQEEG